MPRAKPIRVSPGNGRNSAYRGPESWPSPDGMRRPDSRGAVIVSVEVTEFAPGVTDDEESAQVGIGPTSVDPGGTDPGWTSTAQES